MIILGIDPGTATTGFGIVDFEPQTKKAPKKIRYIDCGVILTSAEKDHALRLREIYEGLNYLVKKFKPEAISVEKLFFQNNAKTAMAVAQARGMTLLVCAQHQIPYEEFTPNQVKMALTGYGRSPKKQIQKMAQMALGLKQVPSPDDAADALCVAICFANAYGFNRLLKNT
jgi:crossover junction endodeoxyribonuclease RuvC